MDANQSIQYDSPKSGSFDEADFWKSMGVHEPTCLFGRIKTSTILRIYAIFSCSMGIYWMLQTSGNDYNHDTNFIFENFWFYAICSLFPLIGVGGLIFKKRILLIIYGVYILGGLVLIVLLGGTGIAMIMKDDFCFRIGEQLHWSDSIMARCINQAFSIRILVMITTIMAILWQSFLLYSIQKYHDYLYRTSWTTIPDDHHDLAMQYHRP